MALLEEGLFGCVVTIPHSLPLFGDGVFSTTYIGKMGLSPLFSYIPQVGMEENKGVTCKLDGFIQIGRCFKERLIDIRRWAGRVARIFADVDGFVGDVGT